MVSIKQLNKLKIFFTVFFLTHHYSYALDETMEILLPHIALEALEHPENLKENAPCDDESLESVLTTSENIPDHSLKGLGLCLDEDTEVSFDIFLSSNSYSEEKLKFQSPDECNLSHLGSSEERTCRNYFKSLMQNKNYTWNEMKEELNRSGVDVDSLNPKELSLLKAQFLYSKIIFNNKSYQENLSFLQGKQEDLDFKTKIALIQNLGRDLKLNYNDQRASSSLTDGKGERVVNCAEAIESIRSDRPGGICRDISACQCDMAKGLGLACWSEASSVTGSFHATPIIYDPKNPNVVAKLNYYRGEDISNTTEDITLLGRSGNYLPTFGTQATIFGSRRGKSTHRTAAVLPLERGLFFQELTGLNSISSDPFLNPRFTILQAGYGNKKCFYKIGHAQLNSGDQIFSISRIRNYKLGEDSTLSIAAAPTLNFINQEVTLFGLFLGMSLQKKLKDLTLSDNTLLTSHIEVNGSAYASTDIKSEKEKILLNKDAGAHILASSTLQVNQGSDRGSEITGEVQLNHCLRDNRNNEIVDFSNYCLLGTYYLGGKNTLLLERLREPFQLNTPFDRQERLIPLGPSFNEVN